MTTFDAREQAFENLFAHDEELRFKVTNRRNKLLGLWAAARLGLHDDEATLYARSLVMTDVEHHSDEDIVHMILDDLLDGGIDTTAPELRAKMQELLPVAHQQVMSE